MPADVENMFSVRQAAWHGLGSILPKYPKSVQEILVAAGLDWDVVELPVTVTFSDGTVVTADDRKGIGRETDHSLLSIMGGGYQPMQPRELVEFAFSLLDATEYDFDMGEEPPILFETGLSLAGGRVNCLLTRVPKDIRIGGIDPVELYLAFVTSHDGSYKFGVHATPVRVVCRNTLNAGLRQAVQSWSTKHTAGAVTSIDEARRTLQLTWKYADAFEEAMNQLIETEFTRRQFEAMVKDLFPNNERAPFSREQYGMLGLLESSPAIGDDIRGTKYGAFNAVTEWWDWGTRFNEGGASTEEKRTVHQLFGPAKKQADRALAYLSSN